MSQEILYTSAPRGLRQGSRGYCTVLATPGMSKTLVEQLESLSGYTHVFPAHIPEAKLNPVNFSHLILTTGGRQYHVLSRIGDAGLDYSQRSNKLAHHVALEKNELVPGGPAWVLSQRNFMESAFRGEPTIIQAGRQPPPGEPPAMVCSHWQQLTGDAGWAGVLAETALQKRAQQAVIIFRPGMELLHLFVEALNLLPPQRRWEVSFSTYFTRLPSGLTCQWRCVLEGTAECKAAMRLPQALVIDLCAPLGKAAAGPLTEAARTGKRPAWPKMESPAHAAVRSTVQVDALTRPDAPIAAPPVAAMTARGPATDAGNLLEAYRADIGPKIAAQSGRPSASFPGWFVAVAVLLILVGTAGGFYAGLLVGRPGAVVTVADVSKKNSAITAGKQEAAKPAANSPQESAAADGKTAPTDAAPAPPAVDAKAPESPPKPVDPPPGSEPAPQAASPESSPDSETPPPAGPDADASASLPVEPTPPPEELWKDLEQRGYIFELPPVGPGSLSGDQPVKKLARLVLANPAECSLELIGLADAFPANLEPRLEKSDAGTWQVLLVSDEVDGKKPREIATFRLDSGSLSFNWGKTQTTLAGMFDLLQNCLLRIRIGDQVSQPCALRKPLIYPPGNFKVNKAKPNEPVAVLTGLPQLSKVNAQHVHLEITAVRGIMQPYEIKPEDKQRHRIIFFPFQYGSPHSGPKPSRLEVELRPQLDNQGARIVWQSYRRVASKTDPNRETRDEITFKQASDLCVTVEKKRVALDQELGDLQGKKNKNDLETTAINKEIEQASEKPEPGAQSQAKQKRPLAQFQARQKRLQNELDKINLDIELVENRAKEQMLTESYYRQLANSISQLEGAQIDYQVYLELEEKEPDGAVKKHRLILAKTVPATTAN